MEQQNTKIKFYVRRTFGEKMNAIFEFVKQNWKPLLKYLTCFVLPVCIIQAFFVNKMMTGFITLFADPTAYNSTMTNPFTLPVIMSSFISIIGSMLFIAPLYTMIQLYNERSTGLNNITFAQLKPYLYRNMGRFLLAMLFIVVAYTVLVVLVGLMMASSVFGMIIVLYLVILVCFIPLSLIVPISIFEKISIWKAFVKSFRLGFPTFGGILGVMIVTGIITFIISMVLMLPWTVLAVLGYMMDVSDTTVGEVAPSGYSMWTYLLSIVSMFGSYLAAVFPAIGLAYQYAHANEKINSVSVVEEIDNFESL